MRTYVLSKHYALYAHMLLLQFSSSRRLPSRLFSSTRRLFGSSAATPATAPPTPGHGSSPSISSVSSRFRTHQTNNSISSIASVSSSGTLVEGTVTQQRRLAEFATMLGDYKLAISVWEALRKEGRGGSVGFYFHSCIRGNPHTLLGRTSYPPSTVPSCIPWMRGSTLFTSVSLAGSYAQP